MTWITCNEDGYNPVPVKIIVICDILISAARYLKRLNCQNTSESYIMERFLFFSSVDILLLKDCKIFWNLNFLTICEVRPPLKQVSPEKNMAFICIVTGKRFGHQIWSPEKNRLSNGITRKQPWFFLVITFEILIFFRWSNLMSRFSSGDYANEIHIFFRWYLFQGGRTS